MKKNKQKKGILKNLLVVFVLIIFTALLIPGVFGSLKFGLDLQGGFEVLYQVETVDDSEITKDVMNSTYKALLKRIDILGVNEPVITIEGNDKIRVQLAGVTDQDEARKILSSAATLTFRDTSDNLLMTSSVLKAGGASVGQDSKGRPAVKLSVSDKDEFYNVTKRISGTTDKTIVIWLDYEEGVSKFANEQGKCGTSESKCLSAATVSQGFASDVIIQGDFTTEEVNNLVSLINSGSLPTKLNELSSKTVGASFGSDSLSKMVIAGSIGFAFVVLIMVSLYRFAGFISSVGLLIYTVLTFGIFWLVGGVLTLPGIAAMVLGIGMAVDSNVINFERIKDEMQSGISLSTAFKKGNKNSISTIIDANLTTFIIALILFIFGESSVKGFATMLMISIVTTMLIMVVFTRVLLKLFVDADLFVKKPKLFIGRIRENIKSFKFVNSAKKFVLISILLIIIGAISLGVKKMNLGVDFKGGTSINIKSENILKIKDVEKYIEKLGYTINDDEVIDDNTVYVKITDKLTQQQILNLKNNLEKDYKASSDIGVVSDMVKRELIKNAIMSLLLAAIAIIIYISLRFRFNYAVSAIVALLHDVFLIFATFSLFNLEVETIFIAAILTIIGYSINDTIVVFDRIRENMNNDKPKNKDELKVVVDKSLNQVIKRSFITSITTIVTVLCLILFGSHEVMEFNIALLVGLVAGTYSSIFIAGWLWYVMESKVVGKPKRKKWYEIDEIEEKKVKGVNN
ncbi:MAG: protein translocase subunit SecD [Bacilli bacterium]|nr:protein translocase subunit SecD [Bacilli bacterium]